VNFEPNRTKPGTPEPGTRNLFYAQRHARIRSNEGLVVIEMAASTSTT